MTPIILFAAGLGTRMRHLTDDRPKPLVEVRGKALIDYALDLTEGLGPKVVNVHYKAAQIRAKLKNAGVLFSDETNALLETGGGLRHAMPLLGSSPVITLNTDAIWVGPNPIKLLMEAWRDEMDGLLMLIPPAAAVGHDGTGDFLTDQEGRLMRGEGSIYSGLQMIRTDTLTSVTDVAFSLNVIWDKMIDSGKLYGVTYPGRWCDVGRPESIPTAEAMLAGADV